MTSNHRQSGFAADRRPPWPLSRALREPVDDASLARAWGRIRSRLDSRDRRSGATGGSRVWAAAGLCAALAASLVLLFTGLPRFFVAPHPPLTVAGERFAGLDTTALAEARSVEFEDGSTVMASPGTLVEAMATTQDQVVLLLRHGTARFSVTPGGPWRWTIEAGLASVDVVGTVFTVSRSSNRVRVAVERGAVLVRSSKLRDGLERLVAGRSLEVSVAPPMPVPSAAASTETYPEGQGASEPRQLPGANPTEAQGTTARALRASSSARTSPPVPRPVGRSDQGVDELLRLADEARLRGNGERARESLSRVVSEHPSDPRAALSAFQVGVIELEQMKKPRTAVRWLRQALSLSPSSSLREDCYLRLVQAELAAGSRQAALETASEYSRAYPSGRHHAAIQRLVSTPPAAERTPPQGP